MRLSSSSLGHLLRSSGSHPLRRRPSVATVRSSTVPVIHCAGHPLHRSSTAMVIHCDGHPLRRSSTATVGHLLQRANRFRTEPPPNPPSCSCTILYHPRTCVVATKPIHATNTTIIYTYPRGHTRGDKYTEGHKLGGHINKGRGYTHGENIHMKERLLEHLICVWN